MFVRMESLRTCSSLGILIYGGTDSPTGEPELFSPSAGGQCGLASLPPPHQLLQSPGDVFCSDWSCSHWSGHAWQPLSLPQGRSGHITWRLEEGFLLLGGRLSSGFTYTSVLVKHDGTFQASFNVIRKFG